MFDVRCLCGKTTRVRPALAGVTIQCPGCGDRLAVPPLSTLRECAARGESAQAKDLNADLDRPTSVRQDSIPESLFFHLCGRVGSDGRISSMALENYVGIILGAVEDCVNAIPPSSRFEMMVSCALLPQNKNIIAVETDPLSVESAAIGELLENLRKTPTPMIEKGPVAFAVYRRLNVGAVGQVELEPFRALKQKIETHGIDTALMQAAGLDECSSSEGRPQRTLVQWLRGFIFGSGRDNDPEPVAGHDVSPADDAHQQSKAWLSELESRFADTPIDILVSAVERDPHDLASLIGLAAKHAEKSRWADAITSCSAAIDLHPTCGPLLARRARVSLSAGHRQASLADWNRSIELAPHEPWYYFYRSEIFADLEAWPQVNADIDKACELAPLEPTFLLCRSNVRLQQSDVQAAADDLRQVLSLDPNSGHAHEQLGSILQHYEPQDLNRSIEHLSRAIELMPDGIEARLHRSMAYASQNKFELALTDCDCVIQRHPEVGAGYGVKGRVLQMNGQYTEAIEACSKALDLGLEVPMVFMARGFAYAATEQSELALLDCDAAEALDPDNPLVYQLRGMLSLQRGELDTAMDALTKARDIVPDWPEPREQIAFLHRINENPEAAIREQSVLVTQQPSCSAHYVNRAFAYTQLGDFEKAQADYDHACELEPENEHIVFLRGCYFMDRQDQEAALRDLDRTLSLASDHDEARYRRAAVLLQLKRQDEALADYEALINKYPEDPHAYTGRAFANQMSGDEHAAEQDFDRLRKIAPEKSEETAIQSLHAKVMWLEQEERYSEAIATAQEIIELAPDQPIGYQLRGWIYWYTEQYVEAYDDYTRLMELDPDEPDLLNARGQIQAEMGEHRLAIDDLDRAIDLCRKAGQTQLLAFALNGRALALAGIERLQESQTDYEESVKLCPNNSWAHYNRGIVLYQQGEYEQARQSFQLALELDNPALTKRKRARTQQFLEKIEG